MAKPTAQAADASPTLDERIVLTPPQVEQIAAWLGALSRDLDGLPVVISQQGEVLAVGGLVDPMIGERLARAADRLWRGGVSTPAREVIRFEEENIPDVERANYLIYSAQMLGALILTVGWQMTISLTQTRAEVADMRARIVRLLR
jgi:hypothetical protein